MPPPACPECGGDIYADEIYACCRVCGLVLADDRIDIFESTEVGGIKMHKEHMGGFSTFAFRRYFPGGKMSPSQARLRGALENHFYTPNEEQGMTKPHRRFLHRLQSQYEVSDSVFLLVKNEFRRKINQFDVPNKVGLIAVLFYAELRRIGLALSITEYCKFVRSQGHNMHRQYVSQICLRYNIRFQKVPWQSYAERLLGGLYTDPEFRRKLDSRGVPWAEVEKYARAPMGFRLRSHNVRPNTMAACIIYQKLRRLDKVYGVRFMTFTMVERHLAISASNAGVMNRLYFGYMESGAGRRKQVNGA